MSDSPGYKPVKTPVILQVEAVECGAAALAIVLGYHGRFVPLEKLRIECGVSRDGSKASNILKVARAHGMTASGHSRTLADARKLKPPFIVFWEFNHFLVVEGVKRDRYYLNDPAIGRRVLSGEDFSAGFTGITLEFAPGKEFVKSGRAYNVVADIRKWIRGFERPLLLTVLTGMLLSVPLVLIPLFSRFYIDYILIQENYDWMNLLVAAILVTLGIIIVLELMMKNILRRLQVKLAVKLGFVFISKLFRLPMQFFLQRDKAEIVSRAELCDMAARQIAGPVTMFFISLFNLLLFSTALLLFQPQLAITGIFFSVLTVWALSVVSKRSAQVNIRFLKERSSLMGYSINGIGMIETLKATGKESEYYERWAGMLTKMNNAEFEAGKYFILSAILPVVMSLLTTIVIVYWGSHMVLDGSITIGGLVGVIALSQSFTSSLAGMAEISKSFLGLTACFRAMNDVYNYGQGAETKPAENALPDLPSPGAFLEIKGLSFGYILLAPPIISDINLQLAKGKSLALVGRSGSGKSTIAKVVTGLYPAWKGRVFLDGMPLEKYTAKHLSRKIAMVEQQTFLFAGTIRENLLLWNDNVSEEEMIEACKLVDLHDEISAKSNGYNFRLEENGRNISGGQRQRIEIARCLLRKPELLVLDEATSALDEATEQVVMQNLLSLDISVLVIAHRLSTVRNCSQVAVFEKGEIVEAGTHEELLEKKARYFELVSRQGD